MKTPREFIIRKLSMGINTDEDPNMQTYKELKYMLAQFSRAPLTWSTHLGLSLIFAKLMGHLCKRDHRGPIELLLN